MSTCGYNTSSLYPEIGKIKIKKLAHTTCMSSSVWTYGCEPRIDNSAQAGVMYMTKMQGQQRTDFSRSCALSKL